MEPADGGQNRRRPGGINPHWIEDPVFMDHLDSLDEVARATTAPIAVGETRGVAYRSLLALDSLSVIILDLTWCAV